MPHVIDTDRMLAEGLVSPDLARDIAERSRATILALVVNTLLCGGIMAATFGLIFWLADALSVAVAGGVFLTAGIAVLVRGGATYRMFGNAAALIGSGMLIAGGAIEIMKAPTDMSGVLILIGAAIAGLAGWIWRHGPKPLAFVTGAVFLMGVALHLAGVSFMIDGATGWPKAAALLYAAALIAAAGAFVNVRTVTALAIVPFAQAMETGTAYYHAVYVFYSPEPTLTILQMTALVAACVFAARRLPDRLARHTGILAIMGAVVGNLAFLVASLWGDHIGLSFATDGRPTWTENMTWEEFNAARAAWEAHFLHISEEVYSVIWAILLGGVAWWAAQTSRRGLFNATMTFAAIHAYTQAFESFADEPLAYVIGGLAAIPVAWGVWRLNATLLNGRTA